MSITTADVAKVAQLARLEFSPEEMAAYEGHLNHILVYIEKLGALDTTTVAPTSHVLDLATPLRADLPRPSLTQDEALRNAPDACDGLLRVPKFVSEG